MANSKKTLSKPVEPKSDIKSLVRKNEFVIGVVTIAVFLGIAVFAYGRTGKTNQTVKMVNTKIENTASSSASPIQTVKTNEPAKTSSTSAVMPKKLSYTSSDIYVTVRKGDSYARLAKRYCGNGKIYMFISEMNGNINLHPGDIVKLSCDF